MLAYSERIERCFTELRRAGRAGLIPFITGGDPDLETSAAILQGLPDAGADLIELGIPFSDPIADGPTIQASSQRALQTNVKLTQILQLVADFRQQHRDTPLILMGYYNPIYRFGLRQFDQAAAQAGVDGVIVVDLPPEEDTHRQQFTNLALIKMAAPTTDAQRLPVVLQHSRGFLYYAAIKGITGTSAATTQDICSALGHLAQHTTLPIAVGFGIRTPEQAASVAQIADAVVVGSAIVEQVATHLDQQNRFKLVPQTLALVADLARAVHQARRLPRQLVLRSI